MSKAFEEIAKEAAELPRAQRLELASRLLDLTEASDDGNGSAEWEQEILARIRAVDEDKVEGLSLETVLLAAEERLTS